MCSNKLNRISKPSSNAAGCRELNTRIVRLRNALKFEIDWLTDTKVIDQTIMINMKIFTFKVNMAMSNNNGCQTEPLLLCLVSIVLKFEEDCLPGTKVIDRTDGQTK